MVLHLQLWNQSSIRTTWGETVDMINIDAVSFKTPTISYGIYHHICGPAYFLLIIRTCDAVQNWCTLCWHILLPDDFGHALTASWLANFHVLVGQRTHPLH